MNSNRSISTINSPEFINLQPTDISPLISSCDIKVLYLNGNRNGSFISKEVATDMAKSLRGSPIVGVYHENKEDFGDHGQVITMDSEGVHFSCETRPYGFVAPDAQVWFQDFEDETPMGETVTRTYLMTTGYLWTGAYPEAGSVMQDGKGQSMEINEETLKGHWSIEGNSNMEFFIIDDAIFEKLCILGDDVEPCFEGASVTPHKAEPAHYSLDNKFKTTLFEMLNELKFALKKGETDGMELENTVSTETSEKIEDNVETTTFEKIEETVETSSDTSEEITTEFKKEDEDKEEDKKESEDESKADEEEDEDKKKDKDKEEYALKAQYEELQSKFEAVSAELEALKSFKAEIDNKKKDDLFNEFTLAEDVVAELKQNKANYSYEELEAKLSVLESRQRRQYAKAAAPIVADAETKPIVTFNVQEDYADVDANESALIKAIKQHREY